MKKILLFNNSSHSFKVHRQSLFLKLVELGHSVTVVLPELDNVDPDVLKKGDFLTTTLSRQGINPIAELKSIYDLNQIVKKIQPDIIHNFTIKCVIYGSFAALINKTSKVINSMTGLGYVFTKNTFITFFLKHLILFFYSYLFRQKNISVIFQNQDDFSLIKKYLGQRSNMHLVYGSGVDVDFFKKQNNNQQFNSKKTIIISCVSRLLYEKGIVNLAEAIDLLARELTCEFECWIIGEVDLGNPGSLSQKEIEKYSNYKRIKFLGQRKDIKELLEKTDIFCLPSFREGLPMAILEAESMSLPIVTTIAPGCRETVTNEHNGYLVEINNSADLKEKLKLLLLSETKRFEFGKNSRTLAEASFSKKIITDKIIKIYGV